MRIVHILAGSALAFAAVGAARSAPPRDQAPIFKAMLDCRALTDNAARLACYDEKVAAMETAERSGDVVVADKAQVRQTKKALFGFGAIRLPIFGGRDQEDAPTQIDAKIVGLRDLGYGKWQFTLDNDMVWRQTDDEVVYPRTGQVVTIRTAAMGSYFMKLKSKAIRVLRTR